MFCPNLVDFHAHLLGQNHDTMVISCVSTKCSMIKRWGGVQMMAHTESLASFLRGETYKLCFVQIWLISMHIYLVKITTQWSFCRRLGGGVHVCRHHISVMRLLFQWWCVYCSCCRYLSWLRVVQCSARTSELSFEAMSYVNRCAQLCEAVHSSSSHLSKFVSCINRSSFDGSDVTRKVNFRV